MLAGIRFEKDLLPSCEGSCCGHPPDRKPLATSELIILRKWNIISHVSFHNRFGFSHPTEKYIRFLLSSQENSGGVCSFLVQTKGISIFSSSGWPFSVSGQGTSVLPFRMERGTLNTLQWVAGGIQSSSPWGNQPIPTE